MAVMTIQEPTAAPDRFIRLLDKSIEKQGLSLRDAASKVGVSIAYLSRLLSKQRGLPADKTIKKFEQVLEIKSGRLFDAAQRHDPLAVRIFKNETARSLVNACENLTDEQIDKVLKEAERLAKTYHPEKK